MSGATTRSAGAAGAAGSAGDAGARFELLTEVVTTQQLVRYAGASDDYNRIHYDQPYAIEAGLGGVVAHGMLTMAFMARAAGEFAGAHGRVERISARFTSPVRPGDAVHVTGVVTSSAQRDGAAGPVRALDCTLSADVGGRVVASGDATLLVPLAPSANPSRG